MGKYSNVVKKQLSKLASNCLKDSKITILWNSTRRLRQIFHFKDRLPMRLRSHILYQYSCDGCNSIYLGKTKRHFGVRAYEHLGLSLRTDKPLTYNPNHNNNSGIRVHLNDQNNCLGNIDNFKIIGKAKTNYHLRLKESILFRKVKPSLNTQETSIPLQLF